MNARFRDEPRRTQAWAALVLCGAVLVTGVVERLVPMRPAYAEAFAPDWIALPASVLAGLAVVSATRPHDGPGWLRRRRLLAWSGCLLMVWAAGGLLIDLLRVAGIIPLPVDWPGLVTRTLALAATIVLAHLTLAPRPDLDGAPVPSWFGYVAFGLALPYPLLKTWWALGGTLGLSRPGVAGHGFDALWLPVIPWLLAAILSLLLVPTWSWIPRWMPLTAGWSAAAVTATIGPAACWSLVSTLTRGGAGIEGMANWVPGLFYVSWLLWAIAISATTRSYQLRSAASEPGHR